ncbi:MAG: hypothetical protein ABIK28_02455, partial [Planctomycetota bacterium]
MKTTSSRIPLVFILMLLFAPAVPMAMAGIGESDPAAAFPEDTLFYLEIREPVSLLCTIKAMSFWPEIEAWVRELTDSELRLDSGFMHHFSDAAGQSLVVGMTPEPVLVFRGCGGARQEEALTWLIDRFTTGSARLEPLEAGAWHVISACDDPGPAKRVADALADEGYVRPGSLSGLGDFQRTMAGLPEE